MALTFDSLAALLDHRHDMLVDVRSPAEFAQDHMPGAVNLPVLSDAERARVGTIYVQQSPFLARKMGAAMVARNAASFLEGPLSAMPGGWRPLVYCWRGGQRSGSFALILSQVGWRAETVAGGYKTWRRLVHEYLYAPVLPHRIVLIDGNTGTGKTALLPVLARAGAQVIDLEGLAGHRGSILGARPSGQPTQRAFESALAAGFARLDPGRPVLIEAESSRIGRLSLPAALWAGMRAAPRIELVADPDARALHLVSAYADMVANPGLLADRLQQLRGLAGNAAVNRWLAALAEGRLADLARDLVRDHYDPAYLRSRRGAGAFAQVSTGDLGAAALETAAAAVLSLVSGR